ncbi:hypothetical protein QBC44DRAFT_37980 [Cladorrhinum sp. PSN332]|nr:hypothetical protein QBC44DRAFT_37980 [Cladorrhinum sp. PSN332]
MPRPIPSGAVTAYTETLTKPVQTPTYGSGGTFTVACSTRISATPSTVLDIVLDAPNYPIWNQFCRKCTIDEQPDTNDTSDANDANDDDDGKLRLGTKFTFDVFLDPEGEGGGASPRPTALKVNILEPVEYHEEGGRKRKGWRVTWGHRPSLLMPEWLLRSERVQEFIEISDSSSDTETEYLCWETFYGPLARVVKIAVGIKVQRGFEVGMEGLKGRAEEVQAQRRKAVPE